MVVLGATFNAVVAVCLLSLLSFRLPMTMVWLDNSQDLDSTFPIDAYNEKRNLLFLSKIGNFWFNVHFPNLKNELNQLLLMKCY